MLPSHLAVSSSVVIRGKPRSQRILLSALVEKIWQASRQPSWQCLPKNDDAQCVVDGEAEVAAEPPSDIAFVKSAYDKGVEFAEDGEAVAQESEAALVGSEDALSAEEMFAEAKAPPILFHQHMLAESVQFPAVRRRLRAKCKSHFSATQLSAGS